jgi:hypothetical protein
MKRMKEEHVKRRDLIKGYDLSIYDILLMGKVVGGRSF